jgi:multimeric flavodoxin WrbA
MDRRAFLTAAGGLAAAGIVSQAVAATDKPAADKPAAGKVKILAVSCSPRKGMTTAAGLQACLDAAAKVDPGIETELIELAGLNIPIFDPAAKGDGDFAKLAPKLADPAVRGIIIGTPVYFGSMSSLCKAFLDQWMAFRKTFALSGKVGGALAVGGMRNGGQELTIQGVQAAMMAQEMVLVGDARPTAHRGATLWNQKDDISKDDVGLATAANLGKRVAEVALRLAGPPAAR